MPSAPCYASTPSEHSAIYSPSPYAADIVHADDDKWCLTLDTPPSWTEVVIVRGKWVKQRVMYPRRLNDQRQLTSITMNGWPQVITKKSPQRTLAIWTKENHDERRKNKRLIRIMVVLSLVRKNVYNGRWQLSPSKILNIWRTSKAQDCNTSFLHSSVTTVRTKRQSA